MNFDISKHDAELCFYVILLFLFQDVEQKRSGNYFFLED